MFKHFKEVYQNHIKNKPSSCYTNRCCSQNKFSLLVCGGLDAQSFNAVKTVNQLDGSNLNKAKALSPMTIARRYSEAVCLKGEVYVFGGCNEFCDNIMSVEKYSPLTNTWRIITNMFDVRSYFCACAFMDYIFIVGGHSHLTSTNSCLQFDTTEKNWKKVSEMIGARKFAACTVFQGNIVVSGGDNIDRNDLNTV